MEIDSQLIRLIFEAGFLAGANNMPDDSETIFNAVKIFRPESEYPYIGSAVTCLNMGKNDDAVRILRDEALKVNPESNIARAFLGLSLKFSGLMDQSRTILQEVIDSGKDEKAVNMAEAILAEMN